MVTEELFAQTTDAGNFFGDLESEGDRSAGHPKTVMCGRALAAIV